MCRTVVQHNTTCGVSLTLEKIRKRNNKACLLQKNVWSQPELGSHKLIGKYVCAFYLLFA